MWAPFCASWKKGTKTSWQEFFQSLDRSEAAYVAALRLGFNDPPWHRKKRPAMGPSKMRLRLMEHLTKSPNDAKRLENKLKFTDVMDLLQKCPSAGARHTPLEEVLQSIENDSWVDLLAQMSVDERDALSRILLHDVPPPGAMTDGLVAALGVDKKLFDRAQRNHPDIAAIARGILVNNALPDRQPGVPCLATPVEEMSLEKALRSGPMAVEPKYCPSPFGLKRDVVLDAELVAVDGDKILPFNEVRRKTGSVKSWNVLAFDVLYYGVSLENRRYRLRRRLLERLVANGNLPGVSAVASTQVHTVSQALTEFRLAKSEGAEGIVLKSVTAGPPKWVKYKGAMDSFDTVLLGAFYGKGRRTPFFGAFLVGIRRGDAFVSFCKVGTGLSDETLQKASQIVEDRRCQTKPENVEVGTLKPEVWCVPRGPLWEISGQSVTKSPSHGAKISLRFPRFLGFRTDKDDVTTLETAQAMLHVR
eukprot:GEMP01048722.1.p1 GENE.GEMP01048722.1~~GEMP01048722.1.p1  ORF type:complete len:499 (+),score=117.89 GEMP01048722.1:73-1497(+)